MTKRTAVAIILPLFLIDLCNSQPLAWSKDFRITYGAEKGGAGRDLRFFDIGPQGDYFFVVHDGGKDYTFLTKFNSEGKLVIKEKVLSLYRASVPSYVFIDGNSRLHVFFPSPTYDYEIAYLQFDENGNKTIDTTLITEIDWLWSTKVIAGTDGSGNIAIFWLEKNATSAEKSNIMYKKIDIAANTLTNTRSLITIDVDVLDWALNFWALFDKDGAVYLFWRESQNHIYYYYYFAKFDIDGNTLKNKMLVLSRAEQFAPEAWNYDRFLVSANRIHLFTSHTEKKTTVEGKFIAMESYINHTLFQIDGNKMSENTVFAEVNGTIFNLLSAVADSEQRIHLAWDDDVDYGPSTSGLVGYSFDQPRELYYLVLNEDGSPFSQATRLTQVDQRNSRNPHLYVKTVNLFLTWSDNRNYEGSDNLNGFDIFLKSTAPISIEEMDVTKPLADAGPDFTVNEDTLITFDGSNSYDNLGVESYTWTFIDVGVVQTLTGVKPTYMFADPGSYEITLNVSDAAGNWATDTVVVMVLDITKPVANAGQDQTVDVGTTVTFDASGSTDNVGIVSYEWNFGDETNRTGKTTTHTYKSPGTYDVTLTVKDEAGNTATSTRRVTVLSVEAFPMWIAGAIVATIAILAIAIAIVLRKRKSPSEKKKGLVEGFPPQLSTLRLALS